MKRFDSTLFNQSLSEQAPDVNLQINQWLKRGNKTYQLSLADFTAITDERKALFEEHHLVDFSWGNTNYFASFLALEPLFYKREYVTHLSACQSIFYYLRAYHSGSVTDEEIREAIEARYREYQGDLDRLIGSFEDFPALEE